MREDIDFEKLLVALLADEEYSGHPLREALAGLMQRYENQLAQLEKLTSISDGYHSALRESNHTLNDRYEKQIRQLQRIVRISDHYQRILQETNKQLKVVSVQDPLTGLPNRRLMQDRLKAESAKTERLQRPFSLAMIDLDHFKSINDTWGHDVGDAALVCVSRELAEHLRAYDICARWGGEEFLVLFPETTAAKALEIAERLRHCADSLCSPEIPEEMSLSVSVGVAEHRPHEEWESTLKRADAALYEAKAAGRNQVALSE